MPDDASRLNWVTGDSFGMKIPAHASALIDAGPEYLTALFQRAGTLSPDNRIVSITKSTVIRGGSTGSKLLLHVAYDSNATGLEQQLFVKFSRDFESKKRDAARYQMDLEIRFANLSMEPGFPIIVPTCYFADFHTATGTGILVTQCIPYGKGNTEPQHEKAKDYQLASPLPYYESLIKSLATLASESKKNGMAEKISSLFPFRPEQLDVGARQTDTADGVTRKVAAFIDFASHYPDLFPDHIRSNKFLSRLEVEAALFQANQHRVNAFLNSNTDLVALCHWNAHVDNAWFWRSESNEIECGLLDWGNVSQMNVAMALWGCLSAAEISFLDQHFEHLLELFVSEYRFLDGNNGVDLLKQHFIVYMASMGLAWLLDGPVNTLLKIDGLETVENRFDPRIQENEAARTQLQILTVFLHLWSRTDMKSVIENMDLQRGIN